MNRRTSALLAALPLAGTLALTACSSTTVYQKQPTSAATTPALAPLSTAYLGCQLYIGGSVADSNPNVVISVTAGATAVSGEIVTVKVGGPTGTGTVTQMLRAGYPVSAQPGQTVALPPINIGVNSPLGNIVAASGCTVISYTS